MPGLERTQTIYGPNNYRNTYKSLVEKSNMAAQKPAVETPPIKASDETPSKPIKPPYGMDEPNSKAFNVLATEGSNAFIKHVFTDQETGRALSYSEMRSRYG